MKRLLVISILLFISSSSFADTIVDLIKIIGLSQSDVAKYLGEPISCGNSKYGKKCQYRKGETEIVYIGGKADWITVEGIDSVPFSSAALNSLGLKVVGPSFKNDFTMRWNAIQGIRELSIFKGSSYSDYAYIKVKTK